MSRWPDASSPSQRTSQDSPVRQVQSDSRAKDALNATNPASDAPSAQHVISSTTDSMQDHQLPNPEGKGPRSFGNAPSRPLGVQSILNPSSPTFSNLSNPTRGRSPTFRSPTAVAATTAVNTSTISASLVATPASRTQSSPPTGSGNRDCLPRYFRSQGNGRILAPRSPVQTGNSTKIVPPTATIDALKSPFLNSSSQLHSPLPSVSRGHDGSFIVTPPAMTKASYGFPTVTESGLRIAGDHAGSTHSLSASPNTPFSSFSQLSQRSPIKPKSPLSHPSFSSTGPPASVRAHAITTGPHISVSASAMSTGGIRMMTVDAGMGPVEVPVDVQSASSVADEKRKRNAGASARFRQRRKEKEREASASIAKLEQRVNVLTKERDFYREERNFYRSVYLSLPNKPSLPPRPRSPTFSHIPPTSVSPSSGPLCHDVQWQRPEDRNESGRNVRRRTGDFPSSHTLPPPLISNTQPFPSPFTPQRHLSLQSYQDSTPSLDPGTTRPGMQELLTPGTTMFDRGWNPTR